MKVVDQLTTTDAVIETPAINQDQMECHTASHAYPKNNIDINEINPVNSLDAISQDFPTDNIVEDTMNSLFTDDSTFEFLNSTAVFGGDGEDFTSLYDNYFSPSSLLVSPTKTVAAVTDDSTMVTSDVNLNSVTTRLFASPSKCVLDFMNTSFDDFRYMNSSQQDDLLEHGLVQGPLTFSPIKFNALNT